MEWNVINISIAVAFVLYQGWNAYVAYKVYKHLKPLEEALGWKKEKKKHWWNRRA